MCSILYIYNTGLEDLRISFQLLNKLILDTGIEILYLCQTRVSFKKKRLNSDARI